MLDFRFNISKNIFGIIHYLELYYVLFFPPVISISMSFSSSFGLIVYFSIIILFSPLVWKLSNTPLVF